MGSYTVLAIYTSSGELHDGQRGGRLLDHQGHAHGERDGRGRGVHALAFPATNATVTGVGSDGTIASFGSSSLSYAYYAGTYVSVAALTAANPSALQRRTVERG